MAVNQALQKLHREVRDIPFIIPYFATGKATGESCTEKHRHLGVSLRSVGVSVQYASVGFRWHELENIGVRYPRSVLHLAETVPKSYHLICKAYHDHPLIVDATWDAPLAAAGFPVNDWDGVSDCALAVLPHDIIPHQTFAERERFTKRLRAAYSHDEVMVRARFYCALNEWLVDLRR
ncbi:TPA: hypothetical protein HA251_02415 [Candidatus Woesearchaeota archaeon]|nr:hypothetical protein [Candidatus Woesearchaeota archaeon]